MEVIKRDGTKEQADFDKIHEVLFWACEGINGVSVSDIALNAKLQIFDGITTSQIHEVLIQSAADLISEETPNYQHVAAKLVNHFIRKNIWGSVDELPNLLYVIKRNIAEGVYDAKLLEDYSEEEINKIGKALRQGRDYNFTYAGVQQMIDKYLLKDRSTGKLYETPQYAYMCIALTLFSESGKGKERMKKVKSFYNDISLHKISLPTPMMSGVRTPNRQYSSCFPAGEKVMLGDGTFKNIEEIEVGDLVVTHKNRKRLVIATRAKEYDGDLISFRSSMCYHGDVTSTQDHLFLSIKKEELECIRGAGVCPPKQGKYSLCTATKDKFKDDCENLNTNFSSTESKWREAKDLKVGDYIHSSYLGENSQNSKEIKISEIIDLPETYVVHEGYIKKATTDPRKRSGAFNDRIHPIKNTISLNNDFYRLLGYILSEGSFHKDCAYTQLTFSIEENEYIQECVALLERVFGAPCGVYPNKSDNSCKIEVSSVPLATFFEELLGSRSCLTTKLPLNILPTEESDIKSFVATFINGDGCTHSNGVSIGLNNPTLISQISALLTNIKLNHSVNITGNAGTISFGKNVIAESMFVEKNLHKCPPASKLAPLPNNHIWFGDDLFVKITSITTKKVELETVYDLQVAEDKSFNVGGLSAHNCTLIDVDDTLTSLFNSNTAIGYYTAKRAGIGLNIGRVRAIGDKIRNGEVVHTGLIPYLKMFESTVKSCTQNGVRGGSATTYVPFWHKEIQDVLVLKNNKGTDDNRVRKLDYGIQFNKTFYKRFIDDETITLFSPNDVEGLYDAFFGPSEEFEKVYLAAEANASIPKKMVKARDLFNQFCQERIGTGRMYVMNVDNANTHSSFLDKIYMSNLCTEITLPTTPIQHIDDGDDTEGEIALCVLSAINVGKLSDLSELEQLCENTVRSLDFVVEHQDYPVEAAKKMLKRRSLGIGVTNLAYYLAKKGVGYEDPKALHVIDELFEHIQYYCIKASMELAKEVGPCEWFGKTKYSQGILPIDTYSPKVDKLISRELTLDWEGLRNDVVKHGMRNSTLTAIMPCESSSVVTNSTNGIEPVRSLVTSKKSKQGILKMVVPEIAKLKNKYTLAFDMSSNKGITNIQAVIQKYIDQGISANHYYNINNFPGGNISIAGVAKDLLHFYQTGGKMLYYANTYDAKTDDFEQNLDGGCESGACSI